jgi:hypothetical protein
MVLEISGNDRIRLLNGSLASGDRDASERRRIMVPIRVAAQSGDIPPPG